MGGGDGIRLARVEIEAPGDRLDAVAGWYADVLGLELDGASVRIGPDELVLAAAAGEARPFYHFAMLVPGDRFGAAHEWLGARAELLPRAGSDETVFDFSFWDALACYAEDPAGNIVELIAHRGLAERGAGGAFAGGELAGISEIGVVLADPSAAAARLERELGLDPWSGDAASGLGFVGRRAHTLIVSRTARGWLPTGRPAEVHPVTVTVSGADGGEADLSEEGHRIVVR
jgi:catechol 2,3-dioxygenase-like lactoylglutathione lyase family enzyme